MSSSSTILLPYAYTEFHSQNLFLKRSSLLFYHKSIGIASYLKSIKTIKSDLQPPDNGYKYTRINDNYNQQIFNNKNTSLSTLTLIQLQSLFMNTFEACPQSQIKPVEKKTKNQKSDSKISRWTPIETVLYIRFLKINFNQIVNHTNKKFLKFQKMSQQIETKSPNQCRSHHQKMIIKFKTIQNIIDGFIPQSETENNEIQAPPQNTSHCQSQLTQENSVGDILKNDDLKNQRTMFSQDLKLCWKTDDNIFDVLFDYGVNE